MATVTILGAGAMGSALATPATAAGHEVRLWGTWLDGDVLADLRAGRSHPRTGVAVDPRAVLLDAGDLAAATTGTDVVVLAVTSDGVLEVLRQALPHLAAGTPVAMCTKGFGHDTAGRVQLLPPLLDAAMAAGRRQRYPVVAIGGPCKANEVAASRPTAAVYAAVDDGAAERVAHLLGTAAYRITTTDDVVGVEAAAALKNVYAIALGIADGLGERSAVPWHNLKAAVFAQAVAEMRHVTVALGGAVDSVYGLAGVGDLEVTGLSGRNKVYGARIGRGEAAGDALADMLASDLKVEGVLAARLAHELAQQRGLQALSLLAAVNDVLDGADDPAARMVEASLPRQRGRA